MSTCTVRSILNLIINTMVRFLLLENPHFLPQQIIKIIMKNYSEMYEICKPISDMISQYSKSVLITPFTAYTILKEDGGFFSMIIVHILILLLSNIAVLIIFY